MQELPPQAILLILHPKTGLNMFVASLKLLFGPGQKLALRCQTATRRLTVSEGYQNLSRAINEQYTKYINDWSDEEEGPATASND